MFIGLTGLIFFLSGVPIYVRYIEFELSQMVWTILLNGIFQYCLGKNCALCNLQICSNFVLATLATSLATTTRIRKIHDTLKILVCTIIIFTLA
jgi:thiamine transporter ThiT